MPPITRLFVRTSLLFFVAALVIALLVAVAPFVSLPPLFSALTPVFFHLFMVGWVTELIVGVAYWMFPKFTREKPRGSDLLAWITYILLNAGLLMRVVAEPANAVWMSTGWGWLLALSACLQWLGGMAFVLNTWPRIKER